MRIEKESFVLWNDLNKVGIFWGGFFLWGDYMQVEKYNERNWALYLILRT